MVESVMAALSSDEVKSLFSASSADDGKTVRPGDLHARDANRTRRAVHEDCLARFGPDSEFLHFSEIITHL